MTREDLGAHKMVYLSMNLLKLVTDYSSIL